MFLFHLTKTQCFICHLRKEVLRCELCQTIYTSIKTPKIFNFTRESRHFWPKIENGGFFNPWKLSPSPKIFYTSFTCGKFHVCPDLDLKSLNNESKRVFVCSENQLAWCAWLDASLCLHAACMIPDLPAGDVTERSPLAGLAHLFTSHTAHKGHVGTISGSQNLISVLKQSLVWHRAVQRGTKAGTSAAKPTKPLFVAHNVC